MKYISGTNKVLNKLKMAGSEILRRVGETAEQVAVQVSIDAKEDHIPNLAHSMDRYENRSTNLTRSIKAELEKVSKDEVVAVVFSEIEYAYPVEAIYPYLWPATVANEELFKKRMREAIKGK